MPLDDRGLLAALRDPRTLAEISRDAGVPAAELEAARDAWLRRHATLTDQRIHRRGRRRGGDQARSRRGAAHLRRGHRRPVLRPRRRDGAGPAVADGPAAPARARPPGGNPRRRLCRQRRGAPDGRDRSDRGARGRGDGRRDARADRALRRRHQPADRADRHRPAGGIPGAGLRTRRRSACATSWRSGAASGGR